MLSDGGKICVRCVASDAGVPTSELPPYVQIVASSILITMDRGRWRWEIRHGGQLVRESRAEFPTLQDAIKDGKQQLRSLWIGDDRPQITRKSQCWRRAAG